MTTDNTNVSERIKSVREWADQQINVISSYEYDAHRLILICSLIDAFAQNDSGYPRNSTQRHFVDFLESYSSRNKGIITEVCPVTLYYDCFSANEANLRLRNSMVFVAGDTALVQEANRLIDLLPEDQQETKIKKHTYGALIYAMRNKLVHEMNSINLAFSYLQDDDNQLPHMVCEYTIENDELIFKKWNLHIPPKFVFDVAIEVIHGYLDHCESEGLDPFYNNDFERRCYYGWY